MAPGDVHLSRQAKDQLVRVKRHTGIGHWNVLCRWAFCLSLRDGTVPALARIPRDSDVEMDWKTFAGGHDEIFLALLKERCLRDGLGAEPEVLEAQFRLHLHRGIAQLAGDRRLRGLHDLVALAVGRPEPGKAGT